MEFVVGDIVFENLTEQVGVVVEISEEHGAQYQVFWYIQGHSLWVDYTEWKDERTLERYIEEKIK